MTNPPKIEELLPAIDIMESSCFASYTLNVALNRVIQAARAYAKLQEDGVVIVPKEPTEGMLHAGRTCEPFITPTGGKPFTPGQIIAGTVYRAMIAAAPPVTGGDLTPESEGMAKE